MMTPPTAPPSDAELLAAAEAFALDDPDPQTRRWLLERYQAADSKSLRPHFVAPLRFGTAGLRGPLGPGPACMNRSTVARATFGVCAYALEAVKGAASRGLCIGYDARHGSRDLAHEAAAVAMGQGFVVQLFDHPVPTPLVAFACRQLQTAAAVVVTASHNPPQDNGYKVYNEWGAQIVAPADRHIAAHMDRLKSVRELPRPALVPANPRLRMRGAADRQAYLATLPTTTVTTDTDTDTDAETQQSEPPLRIAYTPLHGVGADLCLAALNQAGFRAVDVEPTQRDPDPDFPTVAFPNPEEAGTLDAVLHLGETLGADLALANDPDADRLACAARDEHGQLCPFSGNDLGILLADHLLAQASHPGAKLALCYSIVSTPMAERIAQRYGAHPEVTLTGFKWICNRARALETEGYQCVLGFEEALGYAIGNMVRDKDGIAAAVHTAQLAQQCARQGQTLWERLTEICKRDGCFHSAQHAVALTGATTTLDDALERLTHQPPASLAGHPIERFEDLSRGDRQGPLQKLPPSKLWLLYLDSGLRICVRPSGTEPKLKLYFDSLSPMRPEDNLASARQRASRHIQEARHALLTYLELI